MNGDDTQNILKHIFEGSLLEGQADNLATARNYLCTRYRTNTSVTKNFEEQSSLKKKQVENLVAFASERNWWVNEKLNRLQFLTEGGEAKIYLAPSNSTVVKLNDAIYYNTWLDFLNSVIIHNLLFSDTAYTLLGFIKQNENLFAVLEQPFIIMDTATDLNSVRDFLAYNGFINFRRTDYYHTQMQLILEDIHDENVIVSNNKLFFIDTVFYLETNRHFHSSLR